jgi:hypothetical protein
MYRSFFLLVEKSVPARKKTIVAGASHRTTVQAPAKMEHQTKRKGGELLGDVGGGV